MDFSNHPLNKHQLPIANRVKLLKPTANSQLVDELLKDCSDLITPQWEKWFAKRFYVMQPEMVERCASEARVDGKDPRRLFSFLIGKRSM